MIKKLILSSLIGLSVQTQAETDKFVIEAGKPSIQQASQSTANQLVLSVGVFDPIHESLDFSKSKFIVKESSNYTIVQFEEGKTDSQWLRKNGIEIVSYLPNNAFVIVSDHNTKLLLNNNNNIRWSGKYLSNYKIAPSLWPNNLKRQVNHDIAVSIFKNVKKETLKSLFRKFLPNIQAEYNYLGASNFVKLSIHNRDLPQILDKLTLIDAVQYIEPILPMKLSNTEAVSAVQDNSDPDSGPADDRYRPSNTPIWDKGLIGSGQIVGVADSGLDSNEDWFVHYDNGTTVTHAITTAENTSPPTLGTLHPNNKVIAYFVMPGAEAYDHSGAGFHGTHVTGSIAADREQGIVGVPGSASISSPNESGYDNDDGMAPNAQILFQDIGGFFEDEDGNTVSGLTGRGSSPMWEQAYNTGARIHSNSYGADTNGLYFFSDLRADRTLRSFEDMMILFAAGNDGASVNSIGSAGVAKNVVTVGALAHGNSPFAANFSNRGPTDDGRMKPDVMAPGARIESAKGNQINNSEISVPDIKTISGTSMSTPITAGASALMRQYYTDGFYPTGIANPADAHIPTGPLMKATLINGAGIDGGHFDKDIGWGRIYLNNSIMFDDSAKQLRVWEMANANGLKTGESTEIKLGVKSDQPLAITMAWYDVPGPVGSSKTLVNDIDLEVKINGQIYKGNVFTDTAISGTGGTRDSINTVEQVRIPNPVEGIYTITVKGTNIPGDEVLNSFRQGFGLVATGHFDNVNSSPEAITAVANLAASMQGNNGIDITWDGGNNADYYEIYKIEGNCATADFEKLRFTGTSSSNSFTDFKTIDGVQYAYKIRAGQYKSLGDLSTSCIDITSAQACDYLPSFSQSSIRIEDNIGESCHAKIAWNSGISNCPSFPNIKYNVYRSTNSDFTPSPDNLLTTTSNTSFDDLRAPDVPAYYIVRAEDDSGTETTGTTRIRSKAIGTGVTSGPIIEDVDIVSIMNLGFPWQVASSQASDGTLSYKTGPSGGTYPDATCGDIITNTMSITSDLTNPKLTYKTLYNLEESWDGVVVEVSSDNGTSWSDFPPTSGYPGDFSLSSDGEGGVNNQCEYPRTQGAFTGTNDNDDSNTFKTITHDLSPFAGQDIKVRWRLSTDSNTHEEGFYIDSIDYPNVETPSACIVSTAPDRPAPGLYADISKSGHGFAIEPIANSDLYFTVFYTYNDEGTPEWYTSLSTLENNILNVNLDSDTLLRVTHDFTVDPIGAGNPNTIDTTVGMNILKIDFNSSNIANTSACTDGQDRGEGIALATWQLGNQAGEWCIEPLENIIGLTPTNDFGGTWWTGVDDDGWGLSLSFTENNVLVSTLYYFDADGNPRWSQGVASDFQTEQEITIDMIEYVGYGRDETPVSPVGTSTGNLSITINNSGTDGTINLDVTYQGTEGGNWTRSNMPVTIFTAPHN